MGVCIAPKPCFRCVPCVALCRTATTIIGEPAVRSHRPKESHGGARKEQKARPPRRTKTHKEGGTNFPFWAASALPLISGGHTVWRLFATSRNLEEGTGTAENQRNFKDLTRESPQFRAVFNLSPFLLTLLCLLKSKELTKTHHTVWPPLFNGRAGAES